MNRLISCMLSFVLPIQLFGQMFPLSNHYGTNVLAINPAFAGCQDALSISMMYRNQWVGFKDAPKSYLFTAHAPLRNDRIGLGLVIENNSMGIYNQTSIIGNYAYRMNLSSGKLALGLGFAARIYNIAWNKLDVMDADDVQLMNNSNTAVLPSFSLGVYYYTKNYYIGASLPLFLSNELNHSTGNYEIKNSFSAYNYFINGGYEVNLSPQLTLQPSLLLKYHPDHVIQIDYNAKFGFKERFWLGIGYRNKNMLVGMLQCQLNNQLKITYSYDFDYSNLGTYKNASHEMMLNYVFCYTRKIMGPRQF